MSVSESSLRQNRQMVLAALLLLVALALAYIAHLPSPMSPEAGAMSMRGMNMAAAAFSQPWTGVDFLFAFAMWTAMMVGMMAPSFAPTILLYATLGRLATSNKKRFAATAWFAGGYF